MLAVEVVEQMLDLSLHGRHRLLVITQQRWQMHAGHRLDDALQGGVHFFGSAYALKRFFGGQPRQLIKGGLQAFVVEQVVAKDGNKFLLVYKW